jgi:hypothetical protein
MHIIACHCSVSAKFADKLSEEESNNQTGLSQLFIDPSPACNHNKKGDMLGHPGAAAVAVIIMFVADTFRV